MARQYGFYFDADGCVQCRTCEVTCKSVRNLEPGIKWRRVVQNWSGVYPNVMSTFFSLACMRCGKPVCMEVCPTGAISKRGEDGIVVVDRPKCNGCRDCFSACPYELPQFDDNGIMQMCDSCVGINIEAACAVCCPTEALKFGALDELMRMAKGKAAKKMAGPAEPSIVIVGELRSSLPIWHK